MLTAIKPTVNIKICLYSKYRHRHFHPNQEVFIFYGTARAIKNTMCMNYDENDELEAGHRTRKALFHEQILLYWTVYNMPCIAKADGTNKVFG